MEMEIKRFNPCDEAVEFRAKYTTFEQAWNECPRGEWMLWLAKRLDVDFKILTKAKALCALTVRHLMKDQRSINACEVAIKFSEGKASMNELSDAAADAYDAYAAAYAAAADDAAYAAAYAAYAAAYAAAAAADDAADAYAAAYAAAADDAADAYAADADAAHKSNQLKTANICRELLTEAVFEKIKEFAYGF